MSDSALMEKAQNAIDAVYSDTSVPAETTVERLGELQEDIEMRVVGLVEQIERVAEKSEVKSGD